MQPVLLFPGQRRPSAKHQDDFTDTTLADIFNRKFYPGYKTVTLRILPDPAMFLKPFVTGFSLFGIDPVAGIEVEM